MHRWRYGFVAEAIAELCLSTHHPLPLLCCGDWCGGSQIESALRSGWAAAGQAVTLIQHREVVGGDRSESFADFLCSINAKSAL